MRKIFLACLFFFCTGSYNEINSQPAEQLIRVVVAPDHPDWIYKTGETVKFTITVLQHGNPVKNAVVRYAIGPEKMEPVKKDSVSLASGMLTVDGGTMKSPGFLRCTVTAFLDGKQYTRAATAGFDPLNIQPTVANPADFTPFWDKAKAEAAAVPMDARMTLLPERSTEKVAVYHVSLQNFRAGSRLYGILCVPKKEGRYPALLTVPGAGVRGYGGNIAMAERGLITFEIGIHGVPVNMDAAV